MEQENIEVELENYLESGATWQSLPATIRLQLGGKPDVWDKIMLDYLYQHQRPYDASCASRLVKNEVEYYESLMSYSAEHLMVCD